MSIVNRIKLFDHGFLEGFAMGTVHGLMVHGSIRVVTTLFAGGKETFSESGQVRYDDINKVGDGIDGHVVEVYGGAGDSISEILVSTGTGTIKEHVSSLGLADGPIVVRCTDRGRCSIRNRVGRCGTRFGRSGLVRETFEVTWRVLGGTGGGARGSSGGSSGGGAVGGGGW